MISLQNVSFSYRKTKVFDNLSIEFKAGNIYGLMGKNGTGKSTLLATIAGLLYPDLGSVTVLGKTPADRKPDFLNSIFLVPEEFYMPDKSIADYAGRQKFFYPKFDPTAFARYLSQFGIAANDNLRQMSYGQKKKVLISFALACNTALLLMDEPTNGLDIVSKNQFKKIMAGAFDETKCFILSTHQVRDIENLVDRVCFIEDGHILLNESITTIGERLLFRISYDKSEAALFREESIHGEAIIVANEGGNESKIDLELLYKAISVNPDAISSLFKTLRHA